MNYYAHRVTAPAYLIGQVFLAGPVLLLRAWTLLGSRLPDTPEWENRLETALAELRAANKWQFLAKYPDARTEMLYLAQMDRIEFSANKGQPRIRRALNY